MHSDPSIRSTIIAAMQSQDLTAYRLAKKTGVSATVIQRFINGQRDITTRTADRLLAGLKIKREES